MKRLLSALAVCALLTGTSAFAHGPEHGGERGPGHGPVWHPGHGPERGGPGRGEPGREHPGHGWGDGRHWGGWGDRHHYWGQSWFWFSSSVVLVWNGSFYQETPVVCDINGCYYYWNGVPVYVN